MDNNIEFKINKNLVIIVLCVIVGILVAYIILNSISGGFKTPVPAPTTYTSENQNNPVNPAPPVAVVPVLPDYTITSDKVDSDLNVFSSSKLGISFKFLKYAYSDDENNPGIDRTKTVPQPKVVEDPSGSRIYLSNTGNSYLEVFHKESSQSLESAIKNQFLHEIASTECLASRVRAGADDAFYTPTNQISFVRLNNIKPNGCGDAFNFENVSAAFFSISNQPDKFFYIVGESDGTMPLRISNGDPFFVTIQTVTQ